MTAKKSGQASLTPGDRATPNNLFGYSGGTFSPEFKEEAARTSGPSRARGMGQPDLS